MGHSIGVNGTGLTGMTGMLLLTVMTVLTVELCLLPRVVTIVVTIHCGICVVLTHDACKSAFIFFVLHARQTTVACR